MEKEIQKAKKLLFKKCPQEDPLYTHLRQSKHKTDIREHIAKLYVKAQKWGGMDDLFLEDFPINPIQRYWELLVGSWLEDTFPGKVRTLSVGPDYEVQLPSHKLFVECIAPRNDSGQPNIRDQRRGGWIARDASVLRLTGAVKEKAERAKEHLRNGIISQDDALIVAINFSEIPDMDIQENSGIPIALKGLVGAGDHVLSIPVTDLKNIRKDKKQLEPKVEQKLMDATLTKNGGEVRLDAFVTGGYPFISAVITSYDRYMDMTENGKRFTLLHNLTATNQIPLGLMGEIKKEFYCKDGQVWCHQEEQRSTSKKLKARSGDSKD